MVYCGNIFLFKIYYEQRIVCESFFSILTLVTGWANAVQRCPHQADEWDSERHQGVEALRLGEVLPGEGSRNPPEGAQCAAQDRLPQRSLHHGLDHRTLHGEDILHAETFRIFPKSTGLNAKQTRATSRPYVNVNNQIWLKSASPFYLRLTQEGKAVHKS